MTNTLSIEQILKCKPCCTREQLEKIAGDKKEWTALEIMGLTLLSPEDQIRIMCKTKILPDKIVREFACRCVEEALKVMENPDPRSVAAIAAMRAWLKKEISNKELAEARKTADDAFQTAYACLEDHAAYCFTRAVCFAVDATTSLAHWAACFATYVIRHAVNARAYNMARPKQVKILKELINATIE